MCDGNSNVCPIYPDLRDIQIAMCMTVTRPFEWAPVKCRYANQKPIHDFLYDDNSNFLYMMAVVIFTLSVTGNERFAIEGA